MIDTLVTAVKFILNPTAVENRRRHIRYERRTRVQVQPLDELFQPQGPVQWTESRDFSRKGIGFVTNNVIESRFVSISIPDDSISAVAEIKHHTRPTDGRPMYFVGAEFIDDFELRNPMIN